MSIDRLISGLDFVAYEVVPVYVGVSFAAVLTGVIIGVFQDIYNPPPPLPPVPLPPLPNPLNLNPGVPGNDIDMMIEDAQRPHNDIIKEMKRKQKILKIGVSLFIGSLSLYYLFRRCYP
jgi:hypothetical protein